MNGLSLQHSLLSSLVLKTGALSTLGGKVCRALGKTVKGLSANWQLRIVMGCKVLLREYSEKYSNNYVRYQVITSYVIYLS